MSTDDILERDFDLHNSEGLPVATLEHENTSNHSEIEATSNGSNQRKNPKPIRKPRREVWWLDLGTTNHSLMSVGRCFEDRLNWFLLSSSNSLLPHVRSTKDNNLRRNLHQCPGYLREEIALACDLSKSVIVSHAFPGPNERCSICHQLVQYDPYRMDLFNRSESHSSSPSPESTLSSTPNAPEMTYSSCPKIVKLDPRPGPGLMINTNVPRPRIYEANASMESFSAGSSIMQTAIEYDPYSSMYILSSPASHSKGVVIPDSAVIAIGEDKEMTSPSVWMSSSATQMSSPSISSDSYSTDEEDFRFTRSTSPSPEPFDIRVLADFGSGYVNN